MLVRSSRCRSQSGYVFRSLNRFRQQSGAGCRGCAIEFKSPDLNSDQVSAGCKAFVKTTRRRSAVLLTTGIASSGCFKQPQYTSPKRGLWSSCQRTNYFRLVTVSKSLRVQPRIRQIGKQWFIQIDYSKAVLRTHCSPVMVSTSTDITPVNLFPVSMIVGRDL